VAVLRYDDRGVGRSTGDFAAATSADFGTATAAAVRCLLKRAEIDRKAIGLVGHSEGGMVAPIAAAGNDDVRFVILLAALKAPEASRELLVQRLANEWFRYFLQYQPAASLSRIHVPVLAVNGSLDRQVPADENLAAIKTALARNPDVTIRKLEGLNHLFQTARTGAIGEYADIAETMSPVVLNIVAEWIQARFARKGTGLR
jgi:pimeloyl-ACP methyl ester carboxylesterase